MKNKTALIILIVVLGLCACVALLIGGGIYAFNRVQPLLPTLIGFQPLPFTQPSPTYFSIPQTPVQVIPTDTLQTLDETSVPENDYYTLACELKAICNISPTTTATAAARAVGAQDHFWVTDQDTNHSFQVTATLHYVTPHAYFWVENGIAAQDQDIHNLTDAFESKIYPTDRQYFGSEWTPGVDGDPHIYILYTHGMGSSVEGYFSSDDEFNPKVRQYSNGHEMFLINSQVIHLSNASIYGTLAHEFEHMIEWNQHRSEPAWLSEGSAVLASFLNNYDPGGFDRVFILNPDTQLNTWPNGPSESGTELLHYGAGFLFMDYFFNRFGEAGLHDLLHVPQNGLDGVDQVLRDLQAVDAQTGQPLTTEDLFQDWTIANYVQDASVGDGRYAYQNYAAAPRVGVTETISACPLAPASRTVDQFAADYIQFTCPGSFTLHFSGATSTRLLPVEPHSGSYAFWSNLGDSSEMSLTQEFDLSQVSGPIAFTYWTWYDIEKDWDYVYLEASTDGQNWHILTTPSGTGQNPTGSSFGWGYTGTSGDWIHETVDLSQFAGQKVTLRFDYVTDLAVNGQGFLLDDVAIPAIHYASDFEEDNGGWHPAGFVRVQNILPQTFRLALVTHTTSGTQVERIPLSSDQTADMPLTIGQNGVQDATLVVSGTTRFTINPAAYQIEVR
ncbi:MAG: hypothetical protein ABSB41_10765 [Anaerolineales bacterium]|jgi:hypothetical protein